MRILLAVIIMAALPFFALGHGDSTSWEVSSGDYLIDVGYEPEEFSAGAYALFDFALFAEDEPVVYDQVWVRIVRGTDTLLATGISYQATGPTTLLYTPPQEGDYLLDVRFRDAAGADLAQATFPFAVMGGEPAAPRSVLYDVLLFVVGAGIGLVVGRMVRA